MLRSRMYITVLVLATVLGACHPTVTATPPSSPAAYPATPAVTPAPASATAGRTPTAVPATATPEPAVAGPTPTPAPPPDMSRTYESARLGYALPYPDGWSAVETGNRTGFASDPDRARNPDFARGPGAFVLVLKRETVASAAGLRVADVTPAEFLARALLVELPAAPAPQVRPCMVGAQRAAEAYVVWDDAGGGRTAAYALAVEAGTRGVVFAAGAPVTQWPDAWPRLQGMASRLAVDEIGAAPSAPIATLAPGDPFSARLAIVPQTVTFEGSAGDYATLAALAGPSADPALALYDPQGRLLAADDDGGALLSAVLADVPLAQTGTYSAVVWDMGTLSGQYTLELRVSQAPSGGGPLRPGESVAGTLGFTGVQHAWTVTGRAGKPIAVAVTRAGGDVVLGLALLGVHGEILARVEGTQDEPDALLAEFPPDTAGRYTVLVASLQGAGDYRIQMSESPRASGGGMPAESGTAYGGRLEVGVYQRWPMTVKTGVDLHLEATGTGPVEAEVLGAGGARVAWTRSDLEDPSALPVVPGDQLLLHAPAAAGYTFRLEVASVSAGRHGGELEWGTVARRDLRAGEVHRWTLPGGPERVLRLVLDGADELGDYLALYGPDGSRLELLLGVAGDTSIPEWPLVVTGTYTVDVSAYSGSGRYGLLAIDVAAEVTGGGAMAYGDSAFGEIAPGVRHAWTFTGAPGDTLAITVRRGVGDFVPQIAVYAPSGERVAWAVGGEDGMAILEPISLYEAGAYHIVLWGTGATSGDYEITLQ